jgi:hypothetical protein
MPSSTSFEDYVPGGLAALGIELDEVDLAVLSVAHGVWWPQVQQLLETDFSEVRVEPRLDLSQSPQP